MRNGLVRRETVLLAMLVMSVCGAAWGGEAGTTVTLEVPRETKKTGKWKKLAGDQAEDRFIDAKAVDQAKLGKDAKVITNIGAQVIISPNSEAQALATCNLTPKVDLHKARIRGTYSTPGSGGGGGGTPPIWDVTGVDFDKKPCELKLDNGGIPGTTGVEIPAPGVALNFPSTEKLTLVTVNPAGSTVTLSVAPAGIVTLSKNTIKKGETVVVSGLKQGNFKITGSIDGKEACSVSGSVFAIIIAGANLSTGPVVKKAEERISYSATPPLTFKAIEAITSAGLAPADNIAQTNSRADVTIVLRAVPRGSFTGNLLLPTRISVRHGGSLNAVGIVAIKGVGGSSATATWLGDIVVTGLVKGNGTVTSSGAQVSAPTLGFVPVDKTVVNDVSIFDQPKAVYKMNQDVSVQFGGNLHGVRGGIFPSKASFRAGIDSNGFTFTPGRASIVR